MNQPKVMFVGGPDVDLRLELMSILGNEYEMAAVGSRKDLRQAFEPYGFPFYAYPLWRTVNPPGDILTVTALYRLFIRHSPQIVHTFDTKPSVVGRLAARLAHVPVVVGTITGLGTLYMNQGPINRALRMVYEPGQKLVSQLSDCTMFYNPDDARYFVDRGLVSADKTAIVPGSGISPDRFCPDLLTPDEKMELRQKLNLGPDDVVVTMAARLVRSKGILDFAAAAQMVQAAIPEIRFLLVGPRDETSLDRLTQQEIDSLPPHVQWIGRRNDLNRILAMSDIAVLPSGREGIPRVLLEAAATGLPLISSRVPGCSEVVLEGQNGFLIEEHDIQALADAITRLVIDPDLRRQFGETSRQLAVECFSLDTVATMLGSIYRRYLERGSDYGRRYGSRAPTHTQSL